MSLRAAIKLVEQLEEGEESMRGSFADLAQLDPSEPVDTKSDAWERVEAYWDEDGAFGVYTYFAQSRFEDHARYAMRWRELATEQDDELVAALAMSVAMKKTGSQFAAQAMEHAVERCPDLEWCELAIRLVPEPNGWQAGALSKVGARWPEIVDHLVPRLGGYAAHAQQTVAEELAVWGDALLPHAREYLDAKKADVRRAGAYLFRALRDPATRGEIEAAIKRERAAAVRGLLNEALARIDAGEPRPQAPVEARDLQSLSEELLEAIEGGDDPQPHVQALIDLNASAPARAAVLRTWLEQTTRDDARWAAWNGLGRLPLGLPPDVVAERTLSKAPNAKERREQTRRLEKTLGSGRSWEPWEFRMVFLEAAAWRAIASGLVFDHEGELLVLQGETLVDLEGETFEATAPTRLAHRLRMEDADRTRAASMLESEPPFPQLDRDVRTFSDEPLKALEGRRFAPSTLHDRFAKAGYTTIERDEEEQRYSIAHARLVAPRLQITVTHSAMGAGASEMVVGPIFFGFGMRAEPAPATIDPVVYSEAVLDVEALLRPVQGAGSSSSATRKRNG